MNYLNHDWGYIVIERLLMYMIIKGTIKINKIEQYNV